MDVSGHYTRVAFAEQQYFGQEDEQIGQNLHPLEVLLGVIVGIEVLVSLDPNDVSVEYHNDV